MKVLVIKNVKVKTVVSEDKMEKYHKKMLLISFSHQFNTPINGILSILPLLKEKLTDEKDIAQIDTAITSAKFLHNYVKNCIDYMSIKNNEFELRSKPFLIDTLLLEVIGLISPQAHRKGLEIHFERDHNVPDEIFSDSERLQQVLLTLLMNAVKHTYKGVITLRVVQDQLVKSLVLFEVSDTGIGIPLDQKVQLFKLFGGVHQSNLSLSPNQRIGFGLTISNLLCSYLGGELSVRSEEGKGSIFSFYVKISNPKQFVKPSLVTSRSFRNAKNNISSFQQLRAKKHSILVNSEVRKYCPITNTQIYEKVVETESDAECNDTLEFQNEKDIKEIKRFSCPKLFSALSGNGDRKFNFKFSQYLNPCVKMQKGIVGGLCLTPRQKTEFRDTKLESNEKEQFISLQKVSQTTFQINHLKDSEIRSENFLHLHGEDKKRHSIGPKQTDYSTKVTSTLYDPIKQFNHNCLCPLILIVDDIEINKIALGGMVGRLGLSYIEASNGKEALDIVMSQNAPKSCCGGIKIVLMDYDMPIMNGIESCKAIHKQIQAGKITHTSIVAVTAYEGTSIEKECKDAGMIQYLKKPVPIMKLYDCMLKILAQKYQLILTPL